MAIQPRCFITGSAGTGSAAVPLTGWTNALAGLSGTAPQPGDFVLFVLTDNTSAGTVSQTAGTTMPYLSGPTQQSVTNGSFWSILAGKLWTGSETAPTWTWTSGTRNAWMAVAFGPDPGYSLVPVDAQAAEKLDTTAAGTHTPNPATVSAPYTDLSVVTMAASSSTTGTNAINFGIGAPWNIVVSSANVGTSGQYVYGVCMFYRAGMTGVVSPPAITAQGGSTGTGSTNAATNHLLLAQVLNVPLADAAGAADAAISGSPTTQADQAGAADSLIVGITPTQAETAGAAEVLAVQVTSPSAAGDVAAAADGLSVLKGTAPAPVPSTAALPAARVFTASAMPQMHLQNLVTGQWLHRDVRGITQPSVTWVLNGPDTFSCVVSPPRPDLLDATGNPIAQEWQTACYLEQNGRILYGGILTSSQFAGPQWTMGFTGFLGYPPGMIYEGPNYTQNSVDSLDVVRYLWSWLQGQPGSNLGVNVDRTKSGVLLGGQPSGSGSQTTTLSKAARAGTSQVTVKDPTGFANGNLIVISGSNAQHAVTKISKSVLTISPSLGNDRANGSVVYNLGNPVAYKLRWFNSTDIGQEIASIQTETPFEQYESHAWGDPLKQTVTHRVGFGVPRLGTRRLDLRFAEGENITEPVQDNRDGTAYASEVVGLGAGQGSAQIRAQVHQLGGRLRRTYVYTDQTVFTTSRITARAQRVLASRVNIDTPATVVIRNHPNAPFGSFGPGDDILVQQATGWRQVATWCRITQMQQDPTTQAMTLTCLRSDSFTYQGTL